MTRYCPITYQELASHEEKYSHKGLQLLAKKLTTLNDFPYSREEQLNQARLMATKLSIQGVQPKLSVTLDTRAQTFSLCERGGTFILKPQSLMWAHLPENEDLTMRLAATVGINVPLHGLVYCKDGSFSYWIRRFDRPSQKSPVTQKLAVEDFAQLSGANRQTKYQSSMEKVAKIIENFTTFPLIEKEKLLKITLFNYLVGNEDMHLKNFSLIRVGKIVSLSPAYDLLNTTIAMDGQAREELALPLNAKKNRITAADLLEYYGKQRLRLAQKRIDLIFETFKKSQDIWSNLISSSFLPTNEKVAYQQLVHHRFKRLTLGLL